MKTHYKGHPLRKIKKSFEAYDKHNSSTVYTVLLECGHGAIGVPPSTVQIRKNGIACYICPKVETAPERAKDNSEPPAPRKAAEPKVDLTENRDLLRQILDGLRKFDDKLESIDRRLTEVEDIKTAPPIELPPITTQE